MKILVLGGTGAMGVDLVKILGKRCENVMVTSRSERKSEFDNIKFIKGDAHDTTFLQSLLNEKFDAIVDFMVYNTEEFRLRRDLFLNSTRNCGSTVQCTTKRLFSPKLSRRGIRP